METGYARGDGNKKKKWLDGKGRGIDGDKENGDKVMNEEVTESKYWRFQVEKKRLERERGIGARRK